MTETQKIKTHLVNQFGKNLVSLYTYGNPPLQETGPVYVLIVLNSASVNEFCHYANTKKPFKETIQSSCFTEKELYNAIDVFPIEFLEIKQTKKLLHGTDILENIEVHLTHLRHECEYTLRSTLLKLRAALLVPKSNLTNLIFESFPIFFSTLKCIFALNKKPCPSTQESCLNELSKITNIPLDQFTPLLAKNKINESDFQHYINTLSQLTFYVNEL
jgi:hypothetical protein